MEFTTLIVLAFFFGVIALIVYAIFPDIKDTWQCFRQGTLRQKIIFIMILIVAITNPIIGILIAIFFQLSRRNNGGGEGQQ